MDSRKSKIKLDAYLVKEGFATELKEAQSLIMAGKVLVDEQRIDKAGTWVREGSVLRIRGQRRFVSRGGEKLWGAVEDLGLASIFKDAVVLDCGASTGGFTDCALQLGARYVYAVEMGFNQLDWKLRTDPRVRDMAQTDVRDIKAVLDPSLLIVVADLSFNSLARMIPAICACLPPFPAPMHFLLLVKPQFELESEQVPARGVVEDDSSRHEALAKAQLAVEKEGFQLKAHTPSRVRGREGNQEIFLYATRV